MDKLQPKHQRESTVDTRYYLLPRDANAYGTAFGGFIMSIIDGTAAMAASRHCNRPVVTASIDSLSFCEPIRVSDHVVLDARVTYTGRTSMEVSVVVKKENLQEQVTAYSYLDFAENNRKTISARFNGRIEKLLVYKTGDYIKKGQPLFEIYSPDLVQAQNEYLIALNNSVNSVSLLNASKKKLEIFGLTSEQIQTLDKTHEIKITLTYYSPVSGTVIEKKVQEGVYVNEGSTIYEIAELSTLWNIAEVNENNLSSIKVGSPVKLHLRAYPGEEFNGKVTFIYPVINSQTRTVKVRSEFANYGGKLKPQMYGETVFSKYGGQGLLVPADAVIFAGKRAVIWLKTGDGMFEARSVQLGNRFGDKYQIVSGLNEGDEIAATGGFLIDSESQLKTGSPSGDTTKGSKKLAPISMPGMKM